MKDGPPNKQLTITPSTVIAREVKSSFAFPNNVPP